MDFKEVLPRMKERRFSWLLVAVWYMLVLYLYFAYTTLVIYLLSIGVGFFAALFAAPFYPGLIRGLEYSFDSKTGAVRKGYFVYPQQGRIIVIERGDDLYQPLMRYDDHRYRGEKDNDLTPSQPGYYAIESSDGYPDTHPIPPPIKNLAEVFFRPLWLIWAPISLLWWVWKRHVFRLTRAVYSGFKGYQGPHIYPIVRVLKLPKGTGNYDFVVDTSWSNHLRASVFEVVVLVGDANTGDQSAVFVAVSLFLHTIDPGLAAYKTDWKWPERIDALTSGEIGNFCRSRPMNEVLSTTTGQEGELAKHLLETLAHPLSLIGFKFQEGTAVNVLDISPTSNELQRQLEALSVARIASDAEVELARGKLAFPKGMAEINAQDPRAVEIARIDGTVRALEAVSRNPKATVFVQTGSGQSIDQIGAGTLQAVKDLKQGNDGDRHA